MGQEKVKFQRGVSLCDSSHFYPPKPVAASICSSSPQYRYTVRDERAGGEKKVRRQAGIQGLHEDKSVEWNQET